MHRNNWFILVASMGLVGWGCTPSDGDTVTPPDDDGGVEHHRHELAVALDVGHIHAYRDVGIVFTVYDTEDCTDPADMSTCSTMAGLPVQALYRQEGSDRLRTQDLEPGVLEGNGDGTYTWMRSFSEPGGYMVGLQFEEDGEHYMDAFPIHVSKPGSESIFCTDSLGDEYAYQVRWAADPGHVHAGGTEAAFDVELKRSFNSPINAEEPWTNSFDHLTPDDLTALPTITIEEAGSGAVIDDTLVSTYEGEGIYRVTRAFTESDLGTETELHAMLHVTFTDDVDCNVDETGEDYEFHVASGH